MTTTSGTDQISNFQIRPDLKDMSRGSVVKEIIRSTLNEKLGGFVYSAEAADKLTQEIVDALRNRLVEMGLPRYKYTVSIVLEEQRGEGMAVLARCLWDSDTDNYASAVFLA
ncbi:hypothetical protein SK128_026817, partial [Halocaridina rubra]